MNLRERQNFPPASFLLCAPLQTQVVERPETSLMPLLRQDVLCPQPPSWQTCPKQWAERLSCPQLLLLPAMGQLSTELQRATIILLTAQGVFPDPWTRFLSLQIGKNLHSSKDGFQRALQVIPKL